MAEENDLAIFLRSYQAVTHEAFPDLLPSETPDFIGQDHEGRTVGIELTMLKFAPADMTWRRILDAQEWADHNDAHWRIIELLASKGKKLDRAGWPDCERKILIIQLMDCPLHELLPNLVTDQPQDDDFTEVWLADFTMLDEYGGADLFPLVSWALPAGGTPARLEAEVSPFPPWP